MTLAAKQVTEALAARLVPMAATGGRVFQTRTVRLADADLPCWRVIASGEEMQPYTLNGVNLHQLTVLASAYARDTADLDDVLAALAATGEALLFADPNPYQLELVRHDRDVVSDGEASIGVFQITLSARFAVDPRQPEVLL